jgi:hypothetical protein
VRYGAWWGGALCVAVGLGGNAAWAAPCTDCDEDGFTPGEGDCDDQEPLESPGIPRETCGDKLDNDCNGFYDDGCDLSVRQGTLQGGGGCSGNTQNPQPTGGGTATAALLFLPLVRLRRRGAR